MPRPKLPVSKKKADAIQIRLNEEERNVFDRLSSNVGAKELRGVTMTDAGLLRWLIFTVAAERGIHTAEPTAPSSKFPAPKPKKTTKEPRATR